MTAHGIGPDSSAKQPAPRRRKILAEMTQDAVDAGTYGEPAPATRDEVPGWEGSMGPFPSQYGKPHVYARDVHSGAGNCVCSRGLGDRLHVQAAPGVPVPDRMRR